VRVLLEWNRLWRELLRANGFLTRGRPPPPERLPGKRDENTTMCRVVLFNAVRRKNSARASIRSSMSSLADFANRAAPPQSPRPNATCCGRASELSRATAPQSEPTSQRSNRACGEGGPEDVINNSTISYAEAQTNVRAESGASTKGRFTCSGAVQPQASEPAHRSGVEDPGFLPQDSAKRTSKES
jgi:hypothetical protein